MRAEDPFLELTGRVNKGGVSPFRLSVEVEVMVVEQLRLHCSPTGASCPGGRWARVGRAPENPAAEGASVASQ